MHLSHGLYVFKDDQQCAKLRVSYSIQWFQRFDGTDPVRCPEKIRGPIIAPPTDWGPLCRPLNPHGPISGVSSPLPPACQTRCGSIPSSPQQAHCQAPELRADRGAWQKRTLPRDRNEGPCQCGSSIHEREDLRSWIKEAQGIPTYASFSCDWEEWVGSWIFRWAPQVL